MADKFDEFRETLGADTVDTFLSKLGLGPKYTPKEQKKHKCVKCGKEDAVVKEIHPDTDMNEIVHQCKSCGHTEHDI